MHAEECSLAVQNVLKKLDHQYESSFAWWTKIYDPNSGGFYYSISAAKSPKFKPDIESTNKGVQILKWADALNDLSPAFKKGIVHYFNERQDKESGFFYDPQNVNLYSDNSRSRAFGMSLNSLEICGGKPLYKLPMDNSENEDVKNITFTCNHLKLLENGSMLCLGRVESGPVVQEY